MAERVAHNRCTTVERELISGLGFVVLNRFHTKAELSGNLFITLAPGNEPDDFLVVDQSKVRMRTAIALSPRKICSMPKSSAAVLGIHLHLWASIGGYALIIHAIQDR